MRSGRSGSRDGGGGVVVTVSRGVVDVLRFRLLRVQSVDVEEVEEYLDLLHFLVGQR